jgi:hypothetical protein
MQQLPKTTIFVNRTMLLPRRSDNTEARRDDTNNIRSCQLRRTTLDNIPDADNGSNDEEERPPPGMDLAANWIHRVNGVDEGGGDIFRARLNSNMDDATVR